MFSKTTLEGHAILVTGGGSGLGLSMADRFAELGAKVAICGRNEDKLKAAVEQLSRHGNPTAYYPVDVRDFDAVGKMFKQLIFEFGQLNGLVNNAAGNFLAPSEEISPNGFKSVVDIVLHGTFNCTQHFGRYLIDKKQKGSILNIVTTYTHSGSSFVLPSACAKAGVYAMTNSLAFEWATYGIRVNSIAPGPFPTKGAWTRLIPNKSFEKKYLSRIPMNRYGEHIELSNLAVFMMSDLATYINGECVTIDGGEHLQAGQFNFVTQLMSRGKLKALFKLMRLKK